MATITEYYAKQNSESERRYEQQPINNMHNNMQNNIYHNYIYLMTLSTDSYSSSMSRDMSRTNLANLPSQRTNFGVR